MDGRGDWSQFHGFYDSYKQCKNSGVFFYISPPDSMQTPKSAYKRNSGGAKGERRRSQNTIGHAKAEKAGNENAGAELARKAEMEGAMPKHRPAP